ncbi:TonB-dependent receptor [Alkalitalea saponilacus]|uniref:TonB-dependent Receptor Plug Domain n=1 Tax=Alkalitalea saponilacus TaxID=889453 RepID=A0A1T5HN06_9BACT|nr:TonB-dependent receptor [Alkalitalea saponilacus]ASB49367.1 prevent-host-death protein [Alkalitalea saponilacus]SKC22056.1 TonB-dependent Receptor Plug Domain [Alkalitalea saponilacus]
MNKALFLIFFAVVSANTLSQTIKQTIRGQVLDQSTQEPLPFCTVFIEDSDPVLGTTTNDSGFFELLNVPVGRRVLRVSMVGYESYIVNEIIVSSGREINLQIDLRPSSSELDEVVVSTRKDNPQNSMVTLSGRQFTVEETERYAGGLNDPARLASSFAGVATPSVGSNGISVRGNNPNGLLWQIEGVEVPNPNHFANLSVAGGGMLTAISNQIMGNSDFYTGAFPAEYGNASSGVFDIHLRTGNSKKREYTFQAGILGVDFATEGPFKKGGEASYIMNYRYSTMALVSPLLPDNAGVLKYQDLTFKSVFPTQNSGTFTFWGIGAYDGVDMVAADSVDWKADFDRENSSTSLYLYATGLSHQLRLGSRTFLRTAVSTSGDGLSHSETRLGIADLQESPYSKVKNHSGRMSLQSRIQHHFSDMHVNRTGFRYSYMYYNVGIEKAPSEGASPVPLADGKGESGLFQVYSQSTYRVLPNLELNMGINTQLLLLNNSFSVEPRVGIKYHFNENQSLAAAYGVHSRVEQLPLYFVVIDGEQPNKELDLMKNEHFILSWNMRLSPYLRLGIEPYYQRLTNVPVSPDGYLSSVNFMDEIFFNDHLVNEGTGRNMGVDFTFEQFLNRGFYYLFTSSLFDSKYKTPDGVERNTRFNRNYVFNLLAGKEWVVGRDNNNLLSAGFRLNYMGGLRKEPVNMGESLALGEVVYGETPGNLAFENQHSDQPIFSVSFSYRKNRPRYSSVWSLQILNVLATQEFNSHYYHLKDGTIESRYEGILIPNIGYRIEF